MISMQLPLIVNLFAGPGAGKSTMMAEVFAKLKWYNVNAEMAPEFAKELTWEGRDVALDNQIYIFGKQHHRISRLVGKVGVVITDSPLPFSILYAKNDNTNVYKCFESLIWSSFNNFNNLNYFVERLKPYHEAGRSQSYDEALEYDHKILDMLKDNNVSFYIVPGSEGGVASIVFDTMNRLEQIQKIKKED